LELNLSWPNTVILHLGGHTDENHEKYKSGWRESLLRLEKSTITATTTNTTTATINTATNINAVAITTATTTPLLLLLLLQLVTGNISPGVKRPGREADHSPLARAKVKKIWICTSIRPYAFMA
jgi:hypothetical protein